jgi:uncharacterized membrane protein YhaH (DUF805 family)
MSETLLAFLIIFIPVVLLLSYVFVDSGKRIDPKTGKKIKRGEIFIIPEEDKDEKEIEIKKLDPNRFDSKIAKIVRKEIDDQNFEDVTWLKAFKKSKGNKQEAQALYAEYRADELERIYYKKDNKSGNRQEKSLSIVTSYKDNNSGDNDFSFYINRCLTKYAVFNGVAGRAEFWSLYFFTLLISILCFYLDIYLMNSETGVGFFSIISGLVLFFPTIAVSARRLHDIGRSGWWQLIALTGIGVILLIIWYASDTNDQLNRKFK